MTPGTPWEPAGWETPGSSSRRTGPLVTAIIPSTGRVSIKRAVRSVQRQTVPVVPLVVLDEPAAETELRRRLAGMDCRILTTSGRQGAAAARNLGIRTADTDYVAFLDDDDEWTAEKTETQLSAVLSDPAETVVSARALLIGQTSKVVPEELYVPNAGGVASYVLDRSTLRLRRCFMQSSTLLCRRSTALRIPWDETLSRHQDWDWLIRLETGGVIVHQLTEVLIRVFQDSPGSVSHSTDWRASSHWLSRLPSGLSNRARGDFITSVIARAAFGSGSIGTGVRELTRGMACGSHPAAAVVGLSGLVDGRRHRG